MSATEKLAKILGINADYLSAISNSVVEKITKENEKHIKKILDFLKISKPEPMIIRDSLREAILNHEKELLYFIKRKANGQTIFEKTINLAKQIIKPRNGFFLKKELIRSILKNNKPENLLRYLGYSSIEEALSKEDHIEMFSALRFTESNEWMHETFEKTYDGFKADDFEEKPIEVRVIKTRLNDIFENFSSKKFHNVSHLKEFGIIFLKPFDIDASGEFLRDFALILHYFYEIEFYSKLFRKYTEQENFSSLFKSLLRGDVKEMTSIGKEEWLIVQRYLFKENPMDPRLFLRRVNPESMHWTTAQENLTKFAGKNNLNLKIWNGTSWIGDFFNGEFISFDLEDNVMSAVFSSETKRKYLYYHQREAMWNKIFSEYIKSIGDKKTLGQVLIDNFDKGIINIDISNGRQKNKKDKE